MPDETEARAEAWTLIFDVQGAGRALWADHRDAVLAGWVEEQPGTRPSLWWQFDAPRDPAGAPRSYAAIEVPAEPRRRLGGVG